jgi:tetratricopeptide (TPR) repeat protein
MQYTFAALSVALSLCAASAHAAPPSSATPAAPASKPAAAPAPPPAKPAAPAASPAAGEEASNHFKRGLQLFDDGEYTLALVEFERAYQLAPNYRALYNIALVDMQLGRYADASRTLEQYLHDGGDGVPPARRIEVTKTLNDLKIRTATIEISMNVQGAEVTLDGKPLDTARLHGPTVIDAGEHTLRATAPGYLATDKTLTLAGGDKAAVRLELRAFNQPQKPAEITRTHVLFWPGFAITAALAAGSVVAGVVMLDDRSNLNQLKNSPQATAAQLQSGANSSNSAALAADVLGGLAVIAGGISIYLSVGPEHTAKTPSVAVSPQRVVLSMPF